MTPTAGYSGTPLPKKLGIKEGARVGALNPPPHLGELLDPLPAGVVLETIDAPAHPANAERFAVTLAFLDAPDRLAETFAGLADRIEVDGAAWICWPKMKSPLFRGMKENAVREAGLESGLVDNKVCAVDADWSGLRFVHRKENRAALRERRDAE